MITRYPAAEWVPANQSNYRTAGRVAYARVIVHATDGHADPHGTAEMWQQPNHGSSAHFVIGQDGTVLQTVSLADIAWHAHEANALGVGLEHCCRSPGELGPNDAGMPPTEVQLAASARLTAWLLTNMGLHPSRQVIVGHAECDPKTTHADCPTGAGIDLDAYAERVIAIMGAPFA